MMELSELVFGKIKVCEILGTEPDIDTTNNMLKQEITVMINNLKNMTKDELEILKIQQIKNEREINSRPGAMALPQSKIRLFTEYNLRYIEAIKEKISLQE